MKTTRAVGAGIAFVLAITFILRGQVTMTAIPAGTVSLSATNIRTLASLSDAQLEQLLTVLATTPTISPDALPHGGVGGNYYSLAHPNWPPLPGDIYQVPVWSLGSDSGYGYYLLDDVDYFAAANTGSGMRAMDVSDPPSPGDGSDTNSDGGYYSSGFQAQVFTTNDLWLQMVGTTNTGTSMTAYLVINTPWNITNGVYDLFATTNLAPSAWQWVLRCAPGQTNLTVTGLASPNEFFILGLTDDTDGDGLTDAYEKLVSHTNPNLYSTDGTGMSDGWEIQNFGHTGIDPNADPDGDGLTNYQEYMGGTNPNVPDNYNTPLTEPKPVSNLP